jgi:hypothetical protein
VFDVESEGNSFVTDHDGQGLDSPMSLDSIHE